MSDLFSAIELKKTKDEIELILESSGPDINALNKEKESLLNFAIRSNSPNEIIKLFIDKGCQINAKNEEGETPLHYALKNGRSFEIIETLVNYGAGINILTIKNVSPLQFALKYKYYIDVIRFLIHKGADINNKDRIGVTPLHYALIFDSPIEIIELLINNGANLTAKNNSKETPLHYSLRNYKSLNIVKLLLDKGSYINATNFKRSTPLQFSLNCKLPIEVVELLIERCSDINARNKYGATSLHFAINFNSPIEVVKLLINKGANIFATDNYKDSLLHYAANYKSSKEIFSFLIDNGLDINAVDMHQNTTLHYALKSKLPLEIIEFLITKNADVNAVNNKKETPLHFAIRYKASKEVIKLLISKKVNVNALNIENETPLHIAVRINSSMFMLLINNGADMYIQNKNGETPFYFALYRWFDTIFPILLSFGKQHIYYIDDKMPPKTKFLTLYSIIILGYLKTVDLRKKELFMKRMAFDNLNTLNLIKELEKGGIDVKNRIESHYYYPDLSFMTYNNREFIHELLSLQKVLKYCNIDVNGIIQRIKINNVVEGKNGIMLLLRYYKELNIGKKVLKWFNNHKNGVKLSYNAIDVLIEIFTAENYDTKYLKQYKVLKGINHSINNFKTEESNNYLHFALINNKLGDVINHDKLYKLMLDKNKNGWSPLFKAFAEDKKEFTFLLDNIKYEPDYFGNYPDFYSKCKNKQ